MGDASTEQRQNNWWSAWVAKQLHMKVEANGGRNEERRMGRWGRCGEGTGKKKQKNQVQRGGGATGRERAALGKPGRMKMLNQMDVEKESRCGEGRRELKSQGQRQRAQRTGQPGDQILVENGPTGRIASVSAVCLQAARAFTSRRTPLF